MVANPGDVNKLYMRLLGREVYNFGNNTWIDPAAKGRIGQDAMKAVYEISDSPEGQAYEKKVAEALSGPGVTRSEALTYVQNHLT